jgi:hypothetical protein
MESSFLLRYVHVTCAKSLGISIAGITKLIEEKLGSFKTMKEFLPPVLRMTKVSKLAIFFWTGREVVCD